MGIFVMILSAMLSAQNVNAEVKNVWFKTEKAEPRGVVLVAHGLNLRPQKMDSLAELLQADGYDVLRLALSGHDGDLEAFKRVTLSGWENEFLSAYQEASARASAISAPLYFLGYSLGAGLGLDLMNRPGGEVRFAKMALFAPPVAVGPTRRLVKWFGVFGPGFCIPSASPPEYRANPCTPVAAYRALLSAVDGVRQSHLRQSHVPSIVFIDPKDELVSFGGLKKVMRDDNLTEWHLVPVEKSKSIHHLIIDQNALGTRLWELVSNAMLEFFSRP